MSRSRLRERWRRDGAEIDAEAGRPLHFGDPAAELGAALDACVLAERSDLARLLATGPDFLGLLQRLSTGDVASLSPGDGKPTILTTPKGRIVERLFVEHLGEAGVLAVCGPGAGGRVVEHIARFTFAEKTGLADVSDGTFLFALSGPAAERALAAAALSSPAAHGVVPGSIGGFDVRVLGHDGLSGAGRSVTGPLEAAEAAWQALSTAVAEVGGRPAGDQALEAWRVLRGLPVAGRELTEERNPLEAGQWEAVSFDKGCYVGQEVVARLRTYDKVSRELVGLELTATDALPAVGTKLYSGETPVGELTSVVRPPGRPTPVGLGYVKKKALEPGRTLYVGSPDGDVEARIVPRAAA